MRVIHGDCLDVLPTLPDASIDAVVTDPPYGLGFMGQKWDTYANETGRAPSSKRHKFDHVGGNHNPSNAVDAVRTRRVEGQKFQEQAEEWFAACLRVLRPGGHLLAFGGTRTAHRLTCAIEDAGFEIRDTITWLYGSGFPKSLNVGAAIMTRQGLTPSEDEWTPEAEQWRGHGTALKPASEPIIVARKPLAGTVAANVLAHGTGALNIAATRVSHASPEDLATSQAKNPGRDDVVTSEVYGAGRPQQSVNTAGRWPANVVLTHGPDCAAPCAPGCPVAELDAQSGTLSSHDTTPGGQVTGPKMNDQVYGKYAENRRPIGRGDSGGASRFFPTFRYQAKAPTKERPKVGGVAHPTVKPLALMRWLVRLVCPPGGTVLDPFAGSGTTGEAAVLEGFNAVLIERDPTYLPLIEQRRTRRQADTSGDQLTLVGG